MYIYVYVKGICLVTCLFLSAILMNDSLVSLSFLCEEAVQNSLTKAKLFISMHGRFYEQR